MKNGLRAVLIAVVFALVTGCAHSITVTPDTMRLEPVSSRRVTAKIGYYIPEEVSSIEVTTQGGGGDNVRYFPYNDIEPGFRQMLSNVFSGVERLSSTSQFAECLPGWP